MSVSNASAFLYNISTLQPQFQLKQIQENSCHVTRKSYLLRCTAPIKKASVPINLNANVSMSPL